MLAKNPGNRSNLKRLAGGRVQVIQDLTLDRVTLSVTQALRPFQGRALSEPIGSGPFESVDSCDSKAEHEKDLLEKAWLARFSLARGSQDCREIVHSPLPIPVSPYRLATPAMCQ